MRDTKLKSVQALEWAGHDFEKKPAYATFDGHVSPKQIFAPSANVQSLKFESDLGDKWLSIADLIPDKEEQCENATPALGLVTNSALQITDSDVAPDADIKTSEVDSTSDALARASGATPDSVICTSQ